MSYNQFVLDDAAKAVVANAIASGKIVINSTEEVDVKGYATAQADATNIEPENIRKGVNILGVEGDFGEALTFNIISTHCAVNVFRFIDTEWVNISQGRDEGEIAYGASYRVTVTPVGEGQVTTFRCNGVDLTVTSDVNLATTISADPDAGLSIVAICNSGSSSESSIDD